MNSHWCHHNGHDRILIFCNGWGMDATPFMDIETVGYDVLILYDYRDLDLKVDIPVLLSKYDEAVLAGWSMGVMVGQQLFQNSKEIFYKRIAINGTLCPIDDRYGIPRETFKATLDNYNEATRLKFYRRMCKDKHIFRQFLATQPQRDISNQKEELAKLLERNICYEVEDAIYTDVIISDNDAIMPTENQICFWQKNQIKNIKGSHFPFFSWKNWDEFVQIDSGL